MRFAFLSFVAFAGFMVAGALSEDKNLPYTQKKDIVYAEVHGTGLLMDVFTPTGKPNGMAIVDVASGAWYSDRGKILDHTRGQFFSIFCSRGYVMFAVRPGSKTRYTAAEMDHHVKTAVRYVKRHAAEYKIDPAKIGLTGASAGGHLASLAGLTPEAGNPKAKDPVDRQDSSVQAVGVFFPPTDFIDWDGRKEARMDILGPLLFVGGVHGQSADEIKSAAKAISPLHRVDKPKIPFLLIHGDADPLVPLSQSKKLVDAINKTGGSAKLIVKPGGGHPWLTIHQEVKVLADWFDKELTACACECEK